MKNIIKQLKHDKIKINWNTNPIKMDLFVSFLTVDTKVSTKHLGSYNGWTQRYNEELKLFIGGGIVGGVNYLDSIQYGYNLQNTFNHYCNPFYLFDIMTDEGKSFFVDYYKDEIITITNSYRLKVQSLINQLDKVKEECRIINSEFESILIYTA